MKKITLIFISAFILCFTGCKNTNKNIKTNSNIFFSKYYDSLNPINNMLELYNNKTEAIDLKDYTIKIYKDGSITPTYEYNLTGTINSKSFFLIKTNENLNNNADLSLDLKYSGNDAIVLYKQNKICDILGEIGNPIDFGSDITLVKKLEYLNGYNTYEGYYYIPYKVDYYDILKTFNYMTEEELLLGPKLTTDDYNKPFKLTDSLAGGGVITVKLKSCVDGDTAKFTYPTETGILNGTKVRFYNIDTRETMQNNTQEWGIPAKNFTCDKLKNANKIELQSIEGASLFETYGRVLANVWVDGVLLNYEIAKKGYTDVAFGTNLLEYKGISYTNYLVDATNYATLNKLGIHGEKDPYWDYENLKPKN